MIKNKLPKQNNELLKYASKYVDMNVLFKDGKPKVSDITDYKRKKIRKALNTLIALAGSVHYLERDFIPVRRTKRLRAYNNEAGQPIWSAGVMINGGVKHNGKVHITRKIEIAYIRGEYDYTSAPLNALNEDTLKTSIKKHRERIETENATYIGTNGNYLRPSYTEGHTPTELILEKALFLQNKYGGMAARGEKRSNGRLAASMDKWGISLLWQSKRT
jgi:hypothetical protein